MWTEGVMPHTIVREDANVLGIKHLLSQASDYFTSTQNNGPLTAPAGWGYGGNGVDAYGNSSSFPSASFLFSN
jgi:hypothetical protein